MPTVFPKIYAMEYLSRVVDTQPFGTADAGSFNIDKSESMRAALDQSRYPHPALGIGDDCKAANGRTRKEPIISFSNPLQCRRRWGYRAQGPWRLLLSLSPDEHCPSTYRFRIPSGGYQPHTISLGDLTDQSITQAC